VPTRPGILRAADAAAAAASVAVHQSVAYVSALRPKHPEVSRLRVWGVEDALFQTCLLLLLLRCGIRAQLLSHPTIGTFYKLKVPETSFIHPPNPPATPPSAVVPLYFADLGPTNYFFCRLRLGSKKVSCSQSVDARGALLESVRQLKDQFTFTGDTLVTLMPT